MIREHCTTQLIEFCAKFRWGRTQEGRTWRWNSELWVAERNSRRPRLSRSAALHYTLKLDLLPSGNFALILRNPEKGPMWESKNSAIETIRWARNTLASSRNRRAPTTNCLLLQTAHWELQTARCNFLTKISEQHKGRFLVVVSFLVYFRCVSSLSETSSGDYYN